MPKTLSRKLGFLLLLPLLTQCTGIPDGIEPVRNFDLNGYLGTWYEIARLDHRFERGLTSVSATYSLRDDGGVRVVNRGYNTEARKWDEAVGKAFLMGDANVGRLKVSFFGPFYGGYNIIALEKAPSECAMVAGPNRSYLWILCRQANPDQAVVDRLLTKAQSLNFAVDELIFVEHNAANPSPGS